VNNKLEKVWKEAVVPLFKVHMPEGIEEATKNPNQDRKYPSRNFNSGYAEY